MFYCISYSKYLTKCRIGYYPVKRKTLHKSSYSLLICYSNTLYYVEKGKKLLVFEQHTFAKNSASRRKISWTCSSRCSKKCKASVSLSKNGEFDVHNGNHNHPPPTFYINEVGEYVRVPRKHLTCDLTEECNDANNANNKVH